LSHPRRLQIIGLLESGGAMPVHRLVGHLSLSQAATSLHLNRMRRMGLIRRERRGREAWYHLGDARSLRILHCMRKPNGGNP
jgi:DNA-binding transcriptional ArsR family regulator